MSHDMIMVVISTPNNYVGLGADLLLSQKYLIPILQPPTIARLHLQ